MPKVEFDGVRYHPPKKTYSPRSVHVNLLRKHKKPKFDLPSRDI